MRPTSPSREWCSQQLKKFQSLGFISCIVEVGRPVSFVGAPRRYKGDGCLGPCFSREDSRADGTSTTLVGESG